MAGKKHYSLEKQLAYAEGLRHGFAAAQEAVSDMSRGMLTLNEPEEIKGWRERERRLRSDRGSQNQED